MHPNKKGSTSFFSKQKKTQREFGDLSRDFAEHQAVNERLSRLVAQAEERALEALKRAEAFEERFEAARSEAERLVRERATLERTREAQEASLAMLRRAAEALRGASARGSGGRGGGGGGGSGAGGGGGGDLGGGRAKLLKA